MYLSLNGTTLGDVQLNASGKQRLTVYGGFTPGGTFYGAGSALPKALTAAEYLNNELPKSGPVLPEATQDNLGAYTVQSGDTLESIALQLYGDSSLWYVLADANGISDRNATADNQGPLRAGQRLILPPITRANIKPVLRARYWGRIILLAIWVPQQHYP